MMLFFYSKQVLKVCMSLLIDMNMFSILKVVYLSNKGSTGGCYWKQATELQLDYPIINIYPFSLDLSS